MVSITGIVMNILILIMIILVVIWGISVQRDLGTCLSEESQFCLNVMCPCDQNQEVGPCFGMAFRPGPREGTFYCSGSNTLVDTRGRPV